MTKISLINDIIRLSELDHSETKVDFSEQDIYEVALERVELLRDVATRKGVDGMTKNKNGVLLSKKRNYTQSGYGNASIDAVVEKYRGQVKREINGNRYQVSIILNEL